MKCIQIYNEKINKQPNECSVYIWNIVGSLANALLSVIALVMVTRTVNNEQSDIFSIAWSISQLMATIGTYQIRMYQATDVNEKYKFYQYLILRVITLIIMIISSVGYVFVKGYDSYKSTIIIIICLFRVVESLDDVYEGWFQQKERLDLVGKAITYRILFALISFGISLILTHNLKNSCVILLLCYIICFFLYNVRYTLIVERLRNQERIKKNFKWIPCLIKEGAPLFINAFIMMAITNTPKMVIDMAIEQGNLQQGLQTVFNILFMPASFLSLAYIVFRPLITQMAIVWESKKIKCFLIILGKISLGLLGISIALLLGSALVGTPILTFVYGVNLIEYKMQLLVIVLGGCFYTFAIVLDNALIVIRKQYILVVAYVVTWLYIRVVADFMVLKWEMLGASLSYASAMFVFLGVTGVIFTVSLKKQIRVNLKSDK